MKVAIIPARGGSKRIPHKNIKDFCGKPMMAYAIETAIASGCFDKVLVSTDSLEIAGVAESYGAWVPFIRPAELADDHTGTGAVVGHALDWLDQQQYHVEIVCCLYATAPLLQAETLAEGLRLLQKSPDYDHVFSACHFSFPIQRALIQSKNGGCLPFDPESIGKRSQDLEPTFHDAGQFYWTRLVNGKGPSSSVFSEKAKMLVLPAEWVQDIDTESDWKRAEIMYRLLQEQLS
ncbi:pseudaminic acid cytidylyltransferase [Shewanella halifaxensis]|uniref:pseudaminic acid cytidylyltransferase n=1 Tax=Shewanella halifaxensis TaxID=271098 RepID=UPI000D593F26|nr:pseudaminic acid cytidylyltransferase [Shewanella halifaxensis]